jgi:fibronectin type 3 domain-containing protein
VSVASQTISAPTGVTATLRGKRIQISWQPVAGAGTYNVYRGTAPGGEGAVPFASGLTSTSYNDGAVTKGTTYYYRVSALAANGTESALSAEVSASTR